MARGTLSESVKKKSKELFGYEMDQTELRFLPHFQYVMMNDQRINIQQVNAEEMQIIDKWIDAGYIIVAIKGMTITKYFWDKMNEILYIAYIKQED